MLRDECCYRRFFDGDEQALEDLMSIHRESLILFLNGFVHDLNEAESLMMETFAQLVVSGPSFEGRSSLKTYIFSIARNLAFKYNRERHRLRGALFQDLPQADGGADLLLLREERSRQLYAAMQRLKYDYRAVLFLLYFENMTYTQAGQVLGKTEKQIDNLAYRARLRLKDILERTGFSYGEDL